MQPHPFSKYVAILGRGKTKQRHLTLEESRDAMAMLLRGEVEPEQVGAFLMLLRLKEEAPEEIAGFAMGTRDTIRLPAKLPAVDLDWSSYAGKRVHLNWYILSALALVGAGYRVVMHGTEGHTPGRVYTSDVLSALGIAMADSFDTAADQVRTAGFAYIPLQVMSPPLQRMINLRPILGLRSPVHSFTRMLNPFNAPAITVGIFHRGFMDIHAGAARIMRMDNFSVYRGDGGEAERRPNKPAQIWLTHGSEEPIVETWPALMQGHVPKDEAMDPARLAQVWKGETRDEYGEAATIGTIAVALRTMGKADSVDAAEAMAREVWDARDRGRIPAVR